MQTAYLDFYIVEQSNLSWIFYYNLCFLFKLIIKYLKNYVKIWYKGDTIIKVMILCIIIIIYLCDSISGHKQRWENIGIVSTNIHSV